MPETKLKTRLLRGGLYLTVRQLVSMVIAFGGVLLVTRLVGPGEYGLFAGATSLYLFASIMSQWGIGVWLTRAEGDRDLEDFHQGFTLLALSGLATLGLAVLALPLAERWMQTPGFSVPALAVFLPLPLKLAAVAPMARLERALDYRPIAWIELLAQVTFYTVAIPLAAFGHGVWALAIGWAVNGLFPGRVRRGRLSATAPVAVTACAGDLAVRAGLQRDDLDLATAWSGQSANRRALRRRRGHGGNCVGDPAGRKPELCQAHRVADIDCCAGTYPERPPSDGRRDHRGNAASGACSGAGAAGLFLGLPMAGRSAVRRALAVGHRHLSLHRAVLSGQRVLLAPTTWKALADHLRSLRGVMNGRTA